MTFKFEKLDVWQDSLDYLELIYQIASNLPDAERYNLRSQIIRAATSVTLNIAEGSTGQTDAEQTRFLGMALRSLLETVACLHIIHRMDFVTDRTELRQAYRAAEVLTRRLVCHAPKSGSRRFMAERTERHLPNRLCSHHPL